jgi:hypothetical protein
MFPCAGVKWRRRPSREQKALDQPMPARIDQREELVEAARRLLEQTSREATA